MKIALFHNLPSGGAKRHTYEQVRELARRGHKITEYAPTTADVDYCSLAPYIENRYIFDAFLSEDWKLRLPFVTPYIHAIRGVAKLQQTERLNRKIAHEIDADDFDLVFVKDCHIVMNPFVLRFLQTRTIFQCHHGLRHRVELGQATNTMQASLLQKLKAAYYMPAQAMFYRKLKQEELRNIQSASRVLTNSVFSKQLISEHYKIDSHVVYPGINTSLFKYQSMPESDYVLCVGALLYSKGYRFLVSALAGIDSKRRPKLFIAANSRNHEEESIVRDMALRSGVELHIEQITNDERLVQIYNQAKVFIYAPIQEALGMAPLEAMACGTPVVAVAEGGIRETMLDGVTGWLVERDCEAFVERVERLLSNNKMRLQMGQAGIEYVRNNWTWSRAVDRLENEFGFSGN
jgi:glycosyltransferase involved in cell wall biosynthesis